MRMRTWLHIVWAAAATVGILAVARTSPDDWHWPFGLAVFPLAGAVLLIRRPGNKVGRLLATVGAGTGLLFAGEGVVLAWPDRALSLPLEAFVTAAFPVVFWAIVGLLFVFPTGETRPGWSRWAFRSFTVAVLGVGLALLLLSPGPMDITGRENPFGVDLEWIPALADQSFVALPIGALLGVVSLFVRLRRSEGVERAQLKVFLVGAAFVLLLVGIMALPEVEGGVLDVLGRLAVIAGFWALPAAIVAAILRYRLYDIDRIVSRTVTYAVVVGGLVGGYAGLVVTFRSVLPLEGDLPVAVSTLVVASLFLPLVRRVQRVVDRRFFRSRYDAGVVVARFADELRSSLDISDLTSRAEHVITEVLAPAQVEVWLDA